MFGNHATGRATTESDCDSAILMDVPDELERLSARETTRNDISKILEIPAAQVDIVDIANAGLSFAST